jgi:VIT1/CCC1 family predicted Fe2+/Mn2+ transporter
MSTDTADAGPEVEADANPTPFPDPVVYVWLSLLEATIAAGLTIFSIALLEGGELIPDVLAEWTVGLGVFVVVGGLLLARRFYLS